MNRRITHRTNFKTAAEQRETLTANGWRKTIDLEFPGDRGSGRSKRLMAFAKNLVMWFGDGVIGIITDPNGEYGYKPEDGDTHRLEIWEPTKE